MNHIIKVKIEDERDWTWVKFTNWDSASQLPEVKQVQMSAVEALKMMLPKPHWIRGRQGCVGPI